MTLHTRHPGNAQYIPDADRSCSRKQQPACARALAQADVGLPKQYS